MVRTSSPDTMLTKCNYAILKALLTGKYLQGSLSNVKRKQLTEDTGFQNYDPTVKKLEAMGIIIGYVPVLSEKGRKLLDAMRLVYDTGTTSGDEKDASVEEMLEKMV